MKKEVTEMFFILDRSGSMSTIKEQAIKGFNEFLKEQKQLKDEANLTTVLFDDEYDILCEGTDVQEVDNMDTNTYVPRGTTALYDAMGKTISDFLIKYKSKRKKNRPSKVIFAILTDGLENASEEYDQKKVFDLIKKVKKKYDWKFLFLAANQDAIATGSKLGIDKKFCHTYIADAVGTRNVMNNVTKCFTSYRSSGVVKMEDSKNEQS